MAEPARKPESDIEPNIRPNLRVIDGGGETTPGRASLSVVGDQENNPQTTSSNKSVGDQENNPSWPTNITPRGKQESDYGGNKSSPGRRITLNNFKALTKKRGLPTAILVLLVSTGIAGVSFLGTASLPIDLADNLISKLDNRNITDTIRSGKIVQDEFSDTQTPGCDPTTTAECRYDEPSNKLLTEMDEAGIKPLDANGNPFEISTTDQWPSEKPASYQFTENGQPETIPTDEVASKLSSDPTFRASFHEANNPEFLGLSSDDSAFDEIEERFDFKTSDELADATSEDDVKSTINETVAGEDVGVSSEAAELASGGNEATNASNSEVTSAESAVETQLTKTGVNTADQIAEDGKGNAVGILSGIACSLADAPGLMIAAVRTYQMTQLIKYSVIYITLFEAIKAGDANSTEVSAALGAFTATVAGKSAMDSFGIRFGLFGDTSPGDDKTSGNYAPGASIISKLGSLSSITSSAAKKDACAVLTNPATGATIDAATSESLIGPAINGLVGLALSAAIPLVAQPLIDAAVKALPIDQMLSYFVGNLTQNLTAGENVGDAFFSGLSNMFSQLANATGNQALTLAQARDFTKVGDAVDLAYAQEDRATHSPLDPNNPNTLVGSMVSQLLPYYSQMGTLTGVLSSVGSVAAGSFGSLFGGAITNAEDDTAQYSLCQDPAISDAGIAANPWCAIDEGMSSKYLSMDPKAVEVDLVAKGAITKAGDPVPDSSDPLSAVIPKGSTPGSVTSYADWLNLCTDGTTDQALNCELTDQTAEYAVYSSDHPIINDMNGISSSGSTDSTDTTNTTSAYVPNSDNTSEYSQFVSLLSSVNDQVVSTPSVAAVTPAPEKTSANSTVSSLLADLVPLRRAEGSVV